MDECKVKQDSGSSLVSILKGNSNVILECLEISGMIYSNLISDNWKGPETQAEPNCIMMETNLQSENLKMLESQLLAIKNIMLN